ncbi:hypothetical protein JIN82_02215 [Persicirhabdus sediminis]|uniref:Uncharacterized protein n=2 Tax=Persicirhabdus sediminis TaxID=454144 RepID=A0A8J7MCI7_9BACT|nr:hypothetical protein [Persicirhabdus sediminis]
MKRLGGDSKKSLRLKSMLGAKSGFALIATIAVMALMAITAMAMLGLSTVEVRSSSHGDAMEEAKANARMALMIAIGELQKTAGPDQRVTAEGDLDPNPGAGKAHWVGVWSSEDNDNDGNPDGEFEGWLVSRDSNAMQNGFQYTDIHSSAPSVADTSWAEMVGIGSADIQSDDRAQVMAPKVQVNNNMGLHSGNYAWWVGDEGVKARVNLDKEQTEIALASQTNQRPAVEVMASLANFDAGSTEINKLISLQSIGQMSSLSGDISRELFHSATSHSRSIMTDNREGGLKKDLSLLFEMDDDDFEGIDPADYASFVNSGTPVTSSRSVDKGLLFRHDNVYGPTIDTLRNQYRLYKQNIGTSGSPMVKARASYPNKSEFGSDMWRRTACVTSWKNGIKNDPEVESTINIAFWGGGTFPTTRLLHGNLTPYLNRLIMYVSVQAIESGDELYDIHLRFMPVMYVHNPYNVKLEVERMRYLRNLRDANLYFKVITEEGESSINELQLTSLLRQEGSEIINSGDGNAPDAQFVVNNKTEFEPGEVKIFVPNGKVPWGTTMEMTLLGDSFDPDTMAMTFDPHTASGANQATQAIIKMLQGLDPETQLKMMFGWQQWSKQDFEISESDRGGDFNTVFSGFTRTNEGSYKGYFSKDGELQNEPDRVCNSADPHAVLNLTAITPIVVDDLFVKPAKYNTVDSSEKGSIPAFVFGNPLSSSDSNMKEGRVFRPGASVYSAHTYSYLDECNDYSLVTQTNDGAYGSSTWGSQNGASGEKYSVVLEVPTAPMMSLGALQHTNVAPRGHQPALAIGNSFYNLNLSSSQNIVEPGNETQYDLSYLCNHYLWDSYFFSSIGPKPSDSSYESEKDPSSDIKQLITDVYDSVESFNNKQFEIAQSKSVDRQEVEDKLQDFDTSAAYLYLKGGFNVNSTNEEAWKAVLSAFRDQSMRTASGDQANGENSSFSRLSLSPGSGVKGPRGNGDDSWTGFSQLDDGQIAALAESLVAEARKRSESLGGSTPVVPFLTMGQFVNRSPESSITEHRKQGLIQLALSDSGINSSMDSYGVYDSKDQGGESYEIAYEGDAKDLSLPVSASSPAFVLQSDVLQAIGASLVVRSDTFKIRTYGDAVDSNGKIIAQAWCEAIVQRTSQPVEPDPNNELEVDANANDKARRFAIVSFRWLNKDEI